MRLLSKPARLYASLKGKPSQTIIANISSLASLSSTPSSITPRWPRPLRGINAALIILIFPKRGVAICMFVYYIKIHQNPKPGKKQMHSYIVTMRYRENLYTLNVFACSAEEAKEAAEIRVHFGRAIKAVRAVK
jgi:hypothetical protein